MKQRNISVRKTLKVNFGSVKNEKLSLKYYHRISNFAKEMLVQPELIKIAKQDTPLRPSFSSRALSQIDSQTFRQKQPMLFGSVRSGTERVAESIVKNLELDTSPSKKYLLGNDLAILNLRPEEPDKLLGRNGRFRHKAQSGTQMFLDRISREVPIYLNQDQAIKKASALQMAESPRGQELLQQKRQSVLGDDAKEKHKTPFVPFKSLHKKTYFNALEKLLINPQKSPDNEQMLDPSTWGSQRILEYNLKKPPTTYRFETVNKAKNSATERDWYDNLIEAENIIYEKQTIRPNGKNQDDDLNRKISPQAVLKQVLRQCAHNHKTVVRDRSLERRESLRTLNKQISEFYQSTPMVSPKSFSVAPSLRNIMRQSSSFKN